MEVDESRVALATELFGRYLKTEDAAGVTDVVTPAVVEDTSTLIDS